MIHFMGDIHGKFEIVNEYITGYTNKGDTVIIAGDFGYWNRSYLLNWMKEQLKICQENNVIVRFIDGNHEDFPALLEISKGNRHSAIKVMPNVFYQQRGSLEIIEGKRVFFVARLAEAASVKFDPAEFSVYVILRIPEVDYF